MSIPTLGSARGRHSMRTVAVCNQKGGVGKTTIARHLVWYALELGLRVLAVDLDPQRNLTKTLRGLRYVWAGNDGIGASCLTAEGMFSRNAAGLAPLQCGERVALIPSGRELVGVAALPLETLINPRDCLRAFSGDFDLAVIDTAPTLGNPLYAALAASDYALCPVTLDQDAIDGLEDLISDVQRVQGEPSWNPTLRLLGILPNLVNSQRKADLQALAQLRDELSGILFEGLLFDRSATQGAKDRPVWQMPSGESQRRAATEMRGLCVQVFSAMGFAGEAKHGIAA